MRKVTVTTAAAVTALSLAALAGSPAVAYPRPLDAERAATTGREDIQFPQRPDELLPPWTQGQPGDELQAPRTQAHPSDGLQAPRAEQLPGNDTERPLTDEHQAPRA